MNELKSLRPRFENWRYVFLYGLMALIFGFYIFRLFNLQVIRGPELRQQALNNKSLEISTPTQRGLIVDRNGYVLARNVPSYNLVITPANLPGDPTEEPVPGQVQLIYRQLSQLTGVPISNGTLDEQTVKSFTPCATDLGITQIVVIGDTNKPYSPIRIKCNVDVQTAMIIRERATDWAGVGIEVEPVRDYPTGELTSEIIGFLGPIPAVLQDYFVGRGFVANRDKVGYAGIEAGIANKDNPGGIYQNILGGTNGTRKIEIDVAGKELRNLEPPIDPIPGDTVQLTIDTRLQLAAKTALKEEINFWNKYLNKIQSSMGAVIAMNPKTGEILALVSYPTYENNRMARIIPSYYYQQLSIDPSRPLFNNAVSAEHPPGSVFKMAAAVGALNEGVVKPDQLIKDPGEITIIQKFFANDPGKPIRYVCWKPEGHGNVNFLKGVANSCDVYFYKIGGGYLDEVPNGGLGPWLLSEYAKALGYGAPTGIELPGEGKGNIPDPKWKRLNLGENWATGDTYIASMGQGFVTSTVIQVLQSFATLANDGKMMKPTIIRNILSPSGEVIQSFKPVMRWDITKDPIIHIYNDQIQTGETKTVAPWTIQLTKEGLRLVVTEGTAVAQFVDDTTQSAGKTGTAEYCDNIAQKQNLCARKALRLPGQSLEKCWMPILN
jgi:penicillin-binding protein 2